MEEQIIHPNTEIDQYWADLVAPTRRNFLAGAAAVTLGTGIALGAEEKELDFKPIIPPRDQGKSPWGYETINEPARRPKGIRPGEENGLPKNPKPYIAIKSCHAHFYCDGQRSGSRWNLATGTWSRADPSFYFGFTNDLENSVGLTILPHPNTDDPRRITSTTRCG